MKDVKLVKTQNTTVPLVKEIKLIWHHSTEFVSVVLINSGLHKLVSFVIHLVMLVLTVTLNLVLIQQKNKLMLKVKTLLLIIFLFYLTMVELIKKTFHLLKALITQLLEITSTIKYIQLSLKLLKKNKLHLVN